MHKNEAKAIHTWGGRLVRIGRDPSTAPFPVDLSHVSEVELASIECDAVIKNDGTIDDLYRAIRAIAQEGTT